MAEEKKPTLRYSKMPGNRGFCVVGDWDAWCYQFPELPEDAAVFYGEERSGKWRPVAELSGKVVILTTKEGKERRETLRNVAVPTRERYAKCGWSTVGWFAHGGDYAGPGICGEGSKAPAEFYPTCGKEVAHRMHERQEDSDSLDGYGGYYCGMVCSACELYWWHEYRLSGKWREHRAKGRR